MALYNAALSAISFFLKCSYGLNGSSLLLNVKNLLYLFPTKVSMSFKEEIKGATRQGGRKETTKSSGVYFQRLC